MSNNITFVLMYHRHKLLDLIDRNYTLAELGFQTTYISMERVRCSPDRISHRKFAINLFDKSFVHGRATQGPIMLIQ
jgi:hypothetical protein